MADILVVDHYLAIGLLYREVLQDQGHAVCLAMNGKEACLLGLNKSFDIAIVEDRISDIHPEEVLGVLRRCQPHIKGILCLSTMLGPPVNPALWDGTFSKTHDFRILEAEVARVWGESSSPIPTPVHRHGEYGNAALWT